MLSSAEILDSYAANAWTYDPNPVICDMVWVCPSSETGVPFTETAFADTLFTAKFAEPLTEMSLKFQMSAVMLSKVPAFAET